MTWYVASTIMSVRKRKEKQKNIPVYENFLLIEGESEEYAIKKAQEIAEREANISSDGLFLDDKAAYMVFEGIRKLITISNPVSIDSDSMPPINGTELTYSEYLVKNRTQMKNLVQGRPVKLRYVE
ncbi:DUF4288 domain-containing protein [Limnobaculum zhutongyuii]|uniref:DUF4288 domain-containing protein n=1 Tax=Limnobaculum zhutongyuii TaxID=2498113 RepID=A0A411WJL7_9GAMM|nr:DUF4288 domain-containing protein [Limnobaculum zhutongyuii]QBH96366.1 DUF4288 domain-containing protein [Limnobaculum zhutongyuii]TQS86662.1 DUF4288 domain-containing protein [Limnobaculum zhutongyuii]